MCRGRCAAARAPHRGGSGVALRQNPVSAVIPSPTDGWPVVRADQASPRHCDLIPAPSPCFWRYSSFKEPPLTRRIRRRDQGHAVGDESASRNRKFESTSFHRRVCKPSVPRESFGSVQTAVKAGLRYFEKPRMSSGLILTSPPNRRSVWPITPP
jgi:hypothetical protein